MISYISILRGINLGGHKTIKMDALKKMLTDLGFTDVQTYIQSGNAIYKYKKIDPKKINDIIKKNIKTEFGFEVPVITLSLGDLKSIRKANPFIKDKEKQDSFFHITFLADKPQSENINKIKETNYSPDEFVLTDKAVYLYCPKGYGNTKLSNTFFENKLKVSATTRNWKTTNELIKIAEGIENK